jgi:hypothetical protein
MSKRIAPGRSVRARGGFDSGPRQRDCAGVREHKPLYPKQMKAGLPFAPWLCLEKCCQLSAVSCGPEKKKTTTEHTEYTRVYSVLKEPRRTE